MIVMTNNSSENEKNHYTREELFEIRKEKLRLELEAAERLLKSNIEPLLVADKFMHNIYEFLKESLRNRYPDLDEEAINQKIREQSDLHYKLRRKRKEKI